MLGTGGAVVVEGAATHDAAAREVSHLAGLDVGVGVATVGGIGDVTRGRRAAAEAGRRRGAESVAVGVAVEAATRAGDALVAGAARLAVGQLGRAAARGAVVGGEAGGIPAGGAVRVARRRARANQVARAS